MQLCPLRARECERVSAYGGLHAPQFDLDSLSSPTISFSLSRYSPSVSCRAGNLLNSHIYSELWCCPNRSHTDTHTGTRCMLLYGPHRSEIFLSTLVLLRETVRDFYSCLHLFFFFFFYIEVVSIAFHSRISEDVKCKRGKRETCILSCCTSGVR